MLTDVVLGNVEGAIVALLTYFIFKNLNWETIRRETKPKIVFWVFALLIFYGVVAFLFFYQIPKRTTPRLSGDPFLPTVDVFLVLYTGFSFFAFVTWPQAKAARKRGEW